MNFISLNVPQVYAAQYKKYPFSQDLTSLETSNNAGIHEVCMFDQDIEMWPFLTAEIYEKNMRSNVKQAILTAEGLRN